MDSVTLYKRTLNGGISTWSIYKDIHNRQLIIHSQVTENGVTQEYVEDVIPKANRSIEEQMELRMNARVRSKLDGGMVSDKKLVDKALSNQLGFLKPALAKPLKDIRPHDSSVIYYGQPKLDGHRCCILRVGDEVIAYSRAGRLIHTLEHITTDLDIPENVILDGELYCHGESLQTISSWAKRLQINSRKLKFHAYDIIVQNDLKIPFYDRFGLLHEIQYKNKNLEVVDTFSVEFHQIWTSFHKMRDKGYEGLILRPHNGLYYPGRRTSAIIKVKERMDAEALVVGIHLSEKGQVLLNCIWRDSIQFRLVAPGTQYEKDTAYNQRNLYIGKRVTFEYANLTHDGKPFHAAALRWREDL